MAMQKVYNRINWENYPSMETPVNEQNLNKIDFATNELDNRVITHENVKATKEEVAPLITSVTFDGKTGVFTFTRKNGSTFTIDTLLEKIQTNWDYNPETQKLILTMEDGTTQEIDLSELITEFEFVDTATIDFSVDNSGKVSAIVKEGSINEKHLRPDYLADIKVESAKAEASRKAAETAQAEAKKSQTAAATSATESANSAEASADSASESAQSAKNSASSATTATNQALSASNSAKAAQTSATNAATSASNAKTSADTATSQATAASNSASTASTQATNAKNSATQAANYAKEAQSYAKGGTKSREGEDTDNAKYYYEQSKSISESFSGALRPMGTVKFSELPEISSAVGGSMYNISDDFTTTEQFREGAGHPYPAGTNVYKTADGYWDCLAGTPVNKVNGKRGDVTITKEDVGLGNVENTADANKNVNSAKTATTADKVKNALTFTGAVSATYDGSEAKTVNIPQNTDKNVTQNNTATAGEYRVLFSSNANDTTETAGVRKNANFKYNPNTGTLSATNVKAQTGDSTVTFASNDVANGSATAWTNVDPLTTGITHTSFFQKVSTMFKNVRYLYKMLGTTNISAIGGGTVTGAISALNNRLQDQILNKLEIYAISGIALFEVKNGICFIYIEITPVDIAHDVPICWTLPATRNNVTTTFSLGTAGGHNYTSYLRSTDNALCFYYPQYHTVERINTTISYPVS